MLYGEPATDARQRLRDRLKWYLFFRVLLASVFLGGLAWLYLQHETDGYAVSVNLLLLGIAATYGLTILSAVILLRADWLSPFAYLQLGFDVLLTTGIIFVSGGADSPFGFLYSLVVIGAAFLKARPGGIAIAALASIAYATLVMVLSLGLVARPNYPFSPAPPDLQFAVRFATTNATFFVIALLAGTVVHRLHETERLLGEREAERDRLVSLHEALARNLGSALITTDSEGRLSSVNQTAEELAGLPAAEALGKEIGAIFAPLRLTAAGRLQFLQSTGGVQPTEFLHRRADGRELAVRCAAVPLRDTYANPIGALYILQDITSLRRLEDRLRSEDQSDVLPDSSDDDDTAGGSGLIGSSPPMLRVRDFIERAARTDATLLLMGESGTGKELVARAVHARSARRNRPFIAVNCGAIPAELIESELFGHVRGAFTGAVSSRAGLFRAADGGTILLDEVGDLPLNLQVKLLRVLQERSFMAVGSDTYVTVDVRVIAATNRDPAADVVAGRFRGDLYYRLNVLTIALPPLRERRQDIPLLVRHFLRQFSELHGTQVQRLSVGAARYLQDYPYPGNIRELENIIEHAVALCDSETIQEDHLPEYVLQPKRRTGGPAEEATAAPGASSQAAAVSEPLRLSLPLGNLDDNLAAYEKGILLRALAQAGGVKKRAAGLLGINYRSFRHRLEKYGLHDPADREAT